MAEARQTWGERLHVAALAALAKGDDSFRILHDGTHKVRVNPQIRVRDQARTPTVAEQKVILNEVSKSGQARFALKMDVSKAHRRVRVRKEDWGAQACQLDDPNTVWVNCVGTFGIASAGYFWGRLMAALGRGALYLLAPADIWQLIYADDLSWTAVGPRFDLHLILVLLFYTVLGVPFSWRKAGGGLAYDWIGFHMDLTRFEVGLAEGRRNWLIDWLGETLRKKAMLVQHMADVLGRLQYIALVLDQLRPFLGP